MNEWVMSIEADAEVITAETNRWAEEIHAEGHPGYFVPTLDSCPEHTRDEYVRRVMRMQNLPKDQ